MHTAFMEEGLGTAGWERGERDQGPVCIMPWRTIVLNWGKGRKIVFVKITVLKRLVTFSLTTLFPVPF